MRAANKALAAIAIGTALVATGATAQQTPDFAGMAMQGYRNGQQVAAQRAAIDEAKAEMADRQRAQEEADERRDRSKRVGALIDAGHCPEARSLALGEGDIEMAGAVDGLCANRPASPAQ